MQSAKHLLSAVGCFLVCFEVRFKKLAVQVAFVRCRKGIVLGCFTCESSFLYCDRSGKAGPVSWVPWTKVFCLFYDVHKHLSSMYRSVLEWVKGLFQHKMRNVWDLIISTRSPKFEESVKCRCNLCAAKQSQLLKSIPQAP